MIKDFLSILGKIVLSFVLIGVVIGGGVTLFFLGDILPFLDKLSTIDQINYELEERGEEKISMNLFNGELSR